MKLFFLCSFNVVLHSVKSTLTQLPNYILPECSESWNFTIADGCQLVLFVSEQEKVQTCKDLICFNHNPSIAS